MCFESTVCSTSQSAYLSCWGESVGCLKGNSKPRHGGRNAALLRSCAAPSCTEEEEDEEEEEEEEEEDMGRAHPMFYRCHLKKHAQDGLTAMNCNRRQNTKTINKQIGFLEASSVPLTRPGWSLPMRQAVFSSEIRLWSTTPSLIYSCWFAACMFGCGCVWGRGRGRECVCVCVCARVCVCVCVHVWSVCQRVFTRMMCVGTSCVRNKLLHLLLIY